ncbi:MAG: aminotransferase class I/II-fold pyridoxal phosphate-dependent enzyme [Paludibaculum sp.]
MSNGTDEAIQVLVNTFVDHDDEVLIMHPSYAMYRFYAEVAGAVREIEYDAETLSFPIDGFVANQLETKAVMIANPNNPTGTSIAHRRRRADPGRRPECGRADRRGLLRVLRHNGAAVDPEYPNLFVSRTFSKAYGMAALRVGCLLSNKENVQYMRKAQSPYSVNLLAAIAVRAAVEDRTYVSNYAAQAVDAREALYRGFEKRGIAYYPSQANFVLFQAGAQAVPVRDALRARGILVRDRSYELAGTVRVTAGTTAQVARFFQALDEVWK